MKRWVIAVIYVLLCVMWAGCGSTKTDEVSSDGLPPGFHKVEAVSVKPTAAQPQAPAAPLEIHRGQFFSYALPPGWRVGEDGQFALTLASPDNQAITVMVGNAGLPPNYSPAQFVQEKLSALQPQNLRIGPPTPATPITGFARAYQFDVHYTVRGIPSQGVVKCHVAPAYDTATMAMTAALSAASQWPGYAKWLPQVAEQVSAINGAAFGMRGIMAQNLKNSTAYAEAARQYREWSQRTQQATTDARNASQDKNNQAFRENIGGVQPYLNPYDSGAAVELPTTYKYFWIDDQGSIAGTDDPSVNPNTGSTTQWKQMKKRE